MGATVAKLSRNQPCPCGSGKKYKKCCQARLPAAADLTAMLHEGVRQRQAGHLDQAEASFRRVLQVDARNPDALHLLGLTLHQQGHLEQASCLLRAALQASPSNPYFHHNFSIVLKEQNELEPALAHCQKALALKPDYAQAHNSLGVLFKEQGDVATATCHFQKALALDPKLAEAHSNLGTCYKDLGLLAAAQACHRQAIMADPNYAPAYNNLGRVYEDLNQPDLALACFRQAVALRPGDVDLRYNLALLLLRQGAFSEAWPLYESRYHPDRKSPNCTPPKAPIPQWQGEPLAGKCLLIWPEQGFGDEIQFCRYVPVLKHMGAATVTWVCKKPLQPLLATLAGVNAVLSQGDSFRRHDYWAFPLSLPLHCNTTLATVPVSASYLSALPERIRHWQGRMPVGGLRVGLVWKGASQHQNDANRSLAHLDTLAPLFAIPNVRFVSLQKGQGEDEAIGRPLTHLGCDIQDFADTAAIVAQLDLVICVDTAIAHLAGALGKPAWVLLPLVPDWRWLLGREDSPWYPNTTLFRQNTAGDWSDVVARLGERLKAQAGLGATPPVKP